MNDTMKKVMSEKTNTQWMSEEIRNLYTVNPRKAGKSIVTFLEETLKDVPLQEKIAIIDEIAADLIKNEQVSPENTALERDIISKMCTLLLNVDVSDSEITSEHVLLRMSAALNTVFDSVNQIVRTMNSTLFGEQSMDETIRHVISQKIGSEEQINFQHKSLESYLGQINDTFLITHQGFKKAGSVLIKKILDELNPKQISKMAGGGLKIGPLKKAEYYSIYENKYNQFKKWFDSGRFMDDLAREFEKQCTYLKNVNKMKK